MGYTGFQETSALPGTISWQWSGGLELAGGGVGRREDSEILFFTFELSS